MSNALSLLVKSIEKSGIQSSGIFRAFSLFVCALWTATLSEVGWPGTAIAIGFLPPLIFVSLDFKTGRKDWQVKFVLACTAVALFGVALQPGWFNLLVAWVLLLGSSLVVRPEQYLDAISAVWSTMLSVIAAPLNMLASSRAAKAWSSQLFKFLPRPAIASIALPVTAGLVFFGLLAVSNPLIENAIYTLQYFDILWLLNQITRFVSVWSLTVFTCTLMALWPIIQKSGLLQKMNLWQEGDAPNWYLAFFKPSAVLITLVLLNLLFAVQNTLDVKYVWLTGELPAGFTQTEYVRRGAYSLIVTVLLAAVFVVFALRQNSLASNSKAIRILVYLWILQNVSLVASSAQRTMTYIAETGWTEWRVSALLWMTLVSFGLAAVIWRVWKNLSTVWLVNANLAATAILLAVCSVFNLQGFVAERNVDRAIANPDSFVDYAYMQELGPNALPALQRLKQYLTGPSGFPSASTIGPNSQVGKLSVVLGNQLAEHNYKQNDWRSWTLRHAFILTEATP